MGSFGSYIFKKELYLWSSYNFIESGFDRRAVFKVNQAVFVNTLVGKILS